MIAENTTALKLCPFCGDTAISGGNYKICGAYVRCIQTRCGANPEVFVGLTNTLSLDKALAKAKTIWNSRPLDDAVDKQNFLYKEAIGICDTALNEVRHAQEQGKNWYTRGEQGIYEQVRVWVDMGLKAIQRARAQS